METLSESYEKYSKEIHFLKKQISGEKNAHENSLRQLQSSYEIIDEVKDMLRMEQGANLKLKVEVADKNQRMAGLSVQYEEQITAIKDMISLKDQELRRLTSALLVSDVDLIRLKVVNQLQLEHKEELEGLSHEIHRKDSELAQFRAKTALIADKYEFLKAEVKKQEEESLRKQEERGRQHMDEMKDCYETMERDRSDCEKWRKKYELLEGKSKKQIEHYRIEMDKLNRELETENRSLLANGGGGGKVQKMQIEKMEQRSAKLQDELGQERELLKKSENQVNSLKREIKGLKQIENQLKNDKERSEDVISQLKRDIQSKDSQKGRQIEHLRREFESQDREGASNRLEREKISRLETENKRLTFKMDSQQEELGLLRQRPKESGLGAIRKELEEKNGEIEGLIVEIESQKRRERTKSGYQGKDDSVGLKRKLGQANQKIVALLREKVQSHRKLHGVSQLR